MVPLSQSRSHFRGNKVVMDRARKKPKMTIRNWECGIVGSCERFGFQENILKQFMQLEKAVQVEKPWIREANLT